MSTALTNVTEESKQLDIRQSALHIIQKWHGRQIVPMNFNKAISIIESKLKDNDKSAENIQEIKWYICPLEFLLNDDVCTTIMGFIHCAEKTTKICKLNKYWNTKIGKLPISEAFKHIRISKLQRIINAQRLGIFLIHPYSWKEIGYNKQIWDDIYKIENVTRIKDALSAFTCEDSDKSWEDMLQLMKCKYRIRGWFDDEDSTFIVYDIGETILRGIRPLEDEYKEALEYQSPDSDNEDEDESPMYKKIDLNFINNKPKQSWSIIRNAGGWYETKNDFYLVLEVYINDRMVETLQVLINKLQNEQI